MSRSFHYRDKDIWIKLYKIYVRSHLECAVQAWSPWNKSDVNLLEQVQIRAVNMVTGLGSNNYSDRLLEIGLLSLSDRRVRGDAVQVWKYLHGVTPLDPSMIQLANVQHSRVTRHTGKMLNIAKVHARLEVRTSLLLAVWIIGIVFRVVCKVLQL